MINGLWSYKKEGFFESVTTTVYWDKVTIKVPKHMLEYFCECNNGTDLKLVKNAWCIVQVLLMYLTSNEIKEYWIKWEFYALIRSLLTSLLNDKKKIPVLNPLI